MRDLTETLSWYNSRGWVGVDAEVEVRSGVEGEGEGVVEVCSSVVALLLPI